MCPRGWVAGFAVFLVGNVLNFLALARAEFFPLIQIMHKAIGGDCVVFAAGAKCNRQKESRG